MQKVDLQDLRFSTVAYLALLIVIMGTAILGCENPSPRDEAAPDGIVESPGEGENTFAVCPRATAPPCDLVLWMSCYPRQEIGEHYCAACADSRGCGDTESEVVNDLTRRDKLEYFPCEEYEYAIAAIKAWHGQPVDDASWREYLESRRWYREFDEVSLSDTAASNVEELQAGLERCQDEEGATAEDRAFVASWFETLEQTDAPPQAPAEFVDFHAASDAEFDGFIEHLGESSAFEFNRRTPVEVDARGGRVPFEGSAAVEKGLLYDRAITVRPSSSGMMSCTAGGENCEGYEELTFYLNADWELVAQHVTAAG